MRRKLAVSAVLGLLLASPGAAQNPPGFTTYLLGFLVRGTGQLPPGATAQELQKTHLTNLDAMWKDGLLLASGPIADQGDLRGLVIFRGDDRAVVDKRVEDDPLIKAGLLRLEMGLWSGPSGIGDSYRTWAAANPGAPDKMRTYQVVLLKTPLPPKRMRPEDRRAQLVNLDAMAKAGKLIAAGPVLEGSDLAWVYIFNAGAAETDALVATDPAVKAGQLIPERHPWMVAEGVLPEAFSVPVP